VGRAESADSLPATLACLILVSPRIQERYP
jgi:hypothetical protein